MFLHFDILSSEEENLAPSDVINEQEVIIESLKAELKDMKLEGNENNWC